LRILIDESLPRRLADQFPDHDVSTVAEQRWTGLMNGMLLRAAARAGFSVVITADSGLPYQQNLRAIGMSIVVITGVRSRLDDLRPLIPQIVSILAILRPGDVFEITNPKRDSVRDAPLTRECD